MGIPEKIEQQANELQDEISMLENYLESFEYEFETDLCREDYQTDKEYKKAVEADYNTAYEYYENELQALEKKYDVIEPYTVSDIINTFLDAFKLAEIGNATDRLGTKDIQVAMDEAVEKLNGITINTYLENELYEKFVANYNLLCSNINFMLEHKEKKNYVSFINNYNSPWSYDFIKEYKKKGLEITRH